MENRTNIFLFIVLLSFFSFSISGTGCAGKKSAKNELLQPTSLRKIQQIYSFTPEAACSQAIEVINNNSYDQDFFEKVFAKIIDQCRHNKSQNNAELIWKNFIIPLKRSGKVPPDLATTIWNFYFSREFASLPSINQASQYCRHLSEIKKNLEKEYQLKKSGFEICRQGSPDTHFLNAMYVYNTMWAVCHDVE